MQQIVNRTKLPPNTTVVGNPGHPVRVEGRRPEGPDADWIHLPDPVAEAIRGLSSRIAAIEAGAAEVPSESDGHGRSNPSVGPNPAGG